MNKVERNGVVLNGTVISNEMISHEMWHKNPKLFQLWVYLQSCNEVTYGSIGDALGCNKRSVERHIKGLKELGFKYGVSLLETVKLKYCPDSKTRKVIYKVSNNFYDPFSPEEMRAFKEHKVGRFELDDIREKHFDGDKAAYQKYLDECYDKCPKPSDELDDILDEVGL